MKSWGDPSTRKVTPSFPGVTFHTKSIGTFRVSRFYTEPNIWYPVQLDSSSDVGFFLPTTKVMTESYTYSPLPAAAPLRLYLQINEVTPEGYVKPVADKAKSPEPFGYLVKIPKAYVYANLITGLSSQPPSSREAEQEPRADSTPFLALRLPDLVVHHYPGKLTIVGQGILPESLQALLTCI